MNKVDLLIIGSLPGTDTKHILNKIRPGINAMTCTGHILPFNISRSYPPAYSALDDDNLCVDCKATFLSNLLEKVHE